MARSKIAISLDERVLERPDRLVKHEAFPNRSQAIRAAIEEKLTRLEKSRLARACARAGVKAIYALAPRFASTMTVRSNIRTLQDLKGKKLGVQEVGGFADVLSRMVLRKAGVKPEEVTFVHRVGGRAAPGCGRDRHCHPARGPDAPRPPQGPVAPVLGEVLGAGAPSALPKLEPQGEEAVTWRPEVIEVAPPPVSKELKKCWSYFIRKVYETDPLTCPKCQAEMRIISFIDQPEVIKMILQEKESCVPLDTSLLMGDPSFSQLD